MFRKEKEGAGKREEGKGREEQNQRWAEVLAVKSGDLRWIPVAHVKVEAENQHREVVLLPPHECCALQSPCHNSN